MLRRLLAVTLLLLLLLVCAGSAVAAHPGPRLAVVKFEGLARSELFTVDPLGGMKSVLFAGSIERDPAVSLSSPSWSPDGTRVAVVVLTGLANPGGRPPGSLPTMLALVGADGGPVERVPGTTGGRDPVFSPNGREIAFAKDRRRIRVHRQSDDLDIEIVYDSTSIWLADLATGKSRQLTPWRNRLHQTPSSFSPDGARLAFTRLSGDKPPEALAMEFNGSADSVLARNARDPVYSPDGSQIAFLRGPMKNSLPLTDIYVRASSGGGLRRLTETKRAAELAPRWDPSGQRLVYTKVVRRQNVGAALASGGAVMEVNADGTCVTKVFSERHSFFVAAWQPGPGREAGPISC